MKALELFHFLRPWWLMAIPAVLVIWWLIRKRESGEGQRSDLVASHLRDALTINQNVRSAFRPVDGVLLAMLILALAAAGPAWNKQPSPWFAETAPLVIAIEVSDSMRSNDFQPTRLDRARFKVLDLIAQRTGSRTAIIAYDGSAHVVMPPSKDIEVVEPFLESLDPAIMPEKGANASNVLPVATELLGQNAAIGTILFVNDGFDAVDVPLMAEYADQPSSASLAALVVGTDEGGVALMPDGSAAVTAGGGRIETKIDAVVLDRLKNEAGVPVVRAQTGDADVQQLLRHIQSNFNQADDPDAQWNDRGWWLLWPALLLILFWFRRGWTMRW
jgi:Ca-activated chloride channel family protein